MLGEGWGVQASLIRCRLFHVGTKANEGDVGGSLGHLGLAGINCRQWLGCRDCCNWSSGDQLPAAVTWVRILLSLIFGLSFLGTGLIINENMA